MAGALRTERYRSAMLGMISRTPITYAPPLTLLAGSENLIDKPRTNNSSLPWLPNVYADYFLRFIPVPFAARSANCRDFREDELQFHLARHALIEQRGLVDDN